MDNLELIKQTPNGEIQYDRKNDILYIPVEDVLGENFDVLVEHQTEASSIELISAELMQTASLIKDLKKSSKSTSIDTKVSNMEAESKKSVSNKVNNDKNKRRRLIRD